MGPARKGVLHPFNSLLGGGEATRVQEFSRGENPKEGESGFPDLCLAPGLPIHQRQDTENMGSMAPEDLHRPEGAPSARKGILHHQHRSADGEPALNLVSGAVTLGFLPDGERLQRSTFQPAPVGDGVGDGIGAHGESADPRRIQLRVPDDGQSHLSDEELTLRGHGGSSGVDVIVRTCAAGEGKLSDGQGPFHQELQESGSMIHPRELPPGRSTVKGGRARTLFVVAATLLLLPACDRSPVDPPHPRFGQPGEILIQIGVPIQGGEGRIDESFLWESEGSWVLVERMSYGSRPGPALIRNSRTNPGELALQYATLIRELNEAPGLRLFGTVSQDILPVCTPTQTRIAFSITDRNSGERARWFRCAEGGFFTLNPAAAGPDPEASRVVTAIQLVRSFTIGEGERSRFIGTVPFGDLDRGAHTPSRITGSRAFVGTDGTAPSEWHAFWSEHGGEGAPLPVVDWSREFVIVAAVGRRTEAGGTVEVRRILPIGGATRVEVVERVPGDFCSPGAVEAFPYHIAVAPLVPLPVVFADLRTERVPCGS